MTTSSQNPGALPPEQPPVWPVPLYEAFAATGTVAAEMTAGRTAVAAAAVIDAEMAEQDGATSEQLAAAEQRAGILFDAESVEAAVSAAREQARAEMRAELAETRAQLAVMAGAHRQRQAVLRLCEGRLGDDLLLVSAVAAAAEGGTTPYDGLPMTLTWARSVDVPAVGDSVKRTVVHCESSYGGRAHLVVEGEDRRALASLLDTEIVLDIHAPCPHSEDCGTVEDLDAADSRLFGWTRVEVAGVEGGPRWYCTPRCVSNALARAGAELAVIDQMADDLDAEYGPGAADEYHAQVAEATADALDDRDEDGDEL